MSQWAGEASELRGRWGLISKHVSHWTNQSVNETGIYRNIINWCGGYLVVNPPTEGDVCWGNIRFLMSFYFCCSFNSQQLQTGVVHPISQTIAKSSPVLWSAKNGPTQTPSGSQRPHTSHWTPHFYAAGPLASAHEAQELTRPGEPAVCYWTLPFSSLIYPLIAWRLTKHSYGTWPIQFVDLPMNNGDFPSFFVNVYELPPLIDSSTGRMATGTEVAEPLNDRFIGLLPL